MRVGIWPFWSQQDKMAGGMHMLSTCGNAKQLAHVAEVLDIAGVDCRVAVPDAHVGESPFTCPHQYVTVPRENPKQRIHWDVNELESFFDGVDVALLNNEYMAIPLRVLFPKMRIIQMCPVPVDTGLFKHAFDAADLVVVRSNFAKRDVEQYTRTNVSVWSLFYDEELFAAPRPKIARDIDVLFLPRCSANNATHHVEFLQAARNTAWKCVFTDITRYLRKHAATPLEYSSPDTYVDTLFRSKLAVSLYETWNGEMGLYEACRAGCLPIVPATPHLVELFGSKYPYFVPFGCDPTVMRQVICRALGAIADGFKPSFNGIAAGSYQQNDSFIVRDVCQLLH